MYNGIEKYYFRYCHVTWSLQKGSEFSKSPLCKKRLLNTHAHKTQPLQSMFKVSEQEKA